MRFISLLTSKILLHVLFDYNFHINKCRRMQWGLVFPNTAKMLSIYNNLKTMLLPSFFGMLQFNWGFPNIAKTVCATVKSQRVRFH